MQTRFLPAALLAPLFFVITTAAWADDLAAMAGTWTVEKAEANGKPVESDETKTLVVKITGDRYEVQLKDGKDYGSIKLDESAKPKTMDATKTEGLEAGKVLKAIYEISGDTMRVCYAFDFGPRPTAFATEDGSSWVLITYKRER